MSKRSLSSYLERAFAIATDPAQRKRYFLKRSASATFPERLAYDALPRPNYAYGVYRAALEAKALEIPAISAIEFGVAGAAGLFDLERIAGEVERETGVAVQVYGFDTAAGMPPPVDYRDMGYVWATGQFAPHEDFRPRLKKAKFVIGDVAETVPRFCGEFNPAPIGFVAFDLDYYSSTVHALELFEADSSKLLPRVICYMDDIVGDDHELHSAFTGELLAIEEFNAAHAMRKVAPINLLRHKRKIPSVWNDQMFVAHIFDHPLYNQYTNPRWPKPKGQKPLPGVVVKG